MKGAERTSFTKQNTWDERGKKREGWIGGRKREIRARLQKKKKKKKKKKTDKNSRDKPVPVNFGGKCSYLSDQVFQTVPGNFRVSILVGFCQVSLQYLKFGKQKKEVSLGKTSQALTCDEQSHENIKGKTKVHRDEKPVWRGEPSEKIDCSVANKWVEKRPKDPCKPLVLKEKNMREKGRQKEVEREGSSMRWWSYLCFANLHADCKVIFIEIIGDIPADLSVASPLDDNGMEEGQNEDKRREGGVLAVSESSVGYPMVRVAEIELETIGRFRHDLWTRSKPSDVQKQAKWRLGASQVTFRSKPSDV